MLRHFEHDKNLSFKEKIISLDFVLIFSILLLGIISFFAIYSTEQGNFGYYTKSHIYRFTIFFCVFLLVSFLKIQFWYKSSYFFYLIVLILLIFVHFFGVTASGSKRWINLFFVNLQPSELMKVALILFLSRYYYKIPSDSVTNIKYIYVPFIALLFPVMLVMAQPDLGTGVLIAISGMAVVWLTGFRMKYFLYSFFMMICLIPVGISLLKPYQKSRILTFFNPERDPLGAGYQIIQSKIAVGSGGLFGKGFLKGSQSYLDYLPENSVKIKSVCFSGK
jgi:rod shape determining protein RodA